MMQTIELLSFLAAVVTVVSSLVALIGWFTDRGRLAIASVLRRVSTRFDRPVIGAQCAVFMKPRINDLNNENSEAMLPVVKLEFTNSLPESVSVDEMDQVIIVLKDSRNKALNLLRITENYVEQGVMPQGRRIVDKAIKRAVDVTIMFRLLSGVDESLRLWQEKHYEPCISHETTRESLEKTGYMDKQGGYLTRLFLPHLELVARRLGISISPQVVTESRRWLENVFSISLKHHDDPEVYKRDSDLSFVQPNFGVNTVIVARSAVIAEHDIKPHVTRVLQGLADPQINEVYIHGWNETNCYHTIRVVGETYLDPRIAEVSTAHYLTRSRGDDNVPVVLVRYTKGPLLDEEKKREMFRRFQKDTRKALKRKPATRARLLEWLETNGEKHLGTHESLSIRDCGTIVKIMNDEDMTMDVLEYIFENEEIELRLESFLKELGPKDLSPRDELVYRLQVAVGLDNSRIVPFLDPRIFMMTKN